MELWGTFPLSHEAFPTEILHVISVYGGNKCLERLMADCEFPENEGSEKSLLLPVQHIPAHIVVVMD